MKNCPKCFKPHEKLGIYCSRSCANSRIFSDLSIKKKSIATKKYNDSLDSDTKLRLIEKSVTTKKINKKNKIQFADFNELSLNEKRERILYEQNHRCSECNIVQSWNSKPLRFHLDHISGNRKDESRSNLRMLCPNCHSQTDTYGGKNGGKITNKQIEEAILNSENNYEVCGKLGLNPSSHTYSRIEKIRKSMLC